jgi:hypothetical protein
MKGKFVFLLLFVFFFAVSIDLAGAELYKWTDSYGRVHFSSVPPSRSDFVDPFSVAEAILKVKKIKHYQLDLAAKNGDKFSVRIDLENGIVGDILRVTMLEGNSATSYVREKFTTIATKWDPKSGRYYNVPVLNEFYRREFWAIRSAIGQEHPIGKLYGVRKGEPVLLHTDELSKQAAIAMLRQAGWVIYFLPKELQKEFFGE